MLDKNEDFFLGGGTLKNSLFDSDTNPILFFPWDSSIILLTKSNTQSWNYKSTYLVAIYFLYKYHTGYGVSSPGIHNYKDFCRKINIPKGNYWILRIGVGASCQKLGINLVIKWFKSWCYQKCAPKLIFFNEKKWERFPWFLT